MVVLFLALAAMYVTVDRTTNRSVNQTSQSIIDKYIDRTNQQLLIVSINAHHFQRVSDVGV